MAACETQGLHAFATPVRSIRVLRWTFRRDEDAVVCELGLNSDDSAYALRIDTPGGATTELFDDATAAFQRQAAIERMLVNERWLLEAFDSEQVAR